MLPVFSIKNIHLVGCCSPPPLISRSEMQKRCYPGVGQSCSWSTLDRMPLFECKYLVALWHHVAVWLMTSSRREVRAEEAINEIIAFIKYTWIPYVYQYSSVITES